MSGTKNLPLGEPSVAAVDRVMTVLNYWFDGKLRIDRNSEMVKQLAALATSPAPDLEGLRERVAREVTRAISRRMAAEVAPVRSFYTEYRRAEQDAAVKEATDAILSLIFTSEGTKK